jgi:SPP1 family predicted phage head-tail adaptor
MPSGLAAGELNRRISIEAPSTATDSYGQPAQTWMTLLSTWACIRAITSREVYALGAGFTSQVSHKIVLRFTPTTITTAMRVAYRDRTFVIQAISDPDEDRRELNLIVLELSK